VIEGHRIVVIWNWLWTSQRGDNQ